MCIIITKEKNEYVKKKVRKAWINLSLFIIFFIIAFFIDWANKEYQWGFLDGLFKRLATYLLPQIILYVRAWVSKMNPWRLLIIIFRKDGVNMKLKAKEGNKITDKNRTFFNDFIYVPDNYNPDDYEEVPYEIWGAFLEEEVPQNKVEGLEQQIKNLQEDKENLEFVLLDTNFRLTCMELKDEGILE